MNKQYGQAAGILPAGLRAAALSLSEDKQKRVEELRLRTGHTMTAVVDGEEYVFDGPPVTRTDLEQLLELACRGSLHTVLDQLRQGYLTIEGGHRLGLCGRVVLREGEIINLRPLSSASLRIARQVKGIAASVLPSLCEGGRLQSTLILAPPGLGKTTLLRDLLRMVSDGEGCQPHRVGLADQRGEVAALWDGTPQLDVGSRTDILEGCPKAQALMLLLRAMNPQVLAVDEITAEADLEALLAAVGCGVTLLATAHGTDRTDLARRPLYRPLLEQKIFRRLVQIQRTEGERQYSVEVLS